MVRPLQWKKVLVDVTSCLECKTDQQESQHLFYPHKKFQNIRQHVHRLETNAIKRVHTLTLIFHQLGWC
ncbi:MAG: hypothetical protein CSA33_06610 [Desulfobulbus propionicus]|nr:MAG: hypothetical protein CSA33_06610 [Desulfobulbus propionicus]